MSTELYAIDVNNVESRLLLTEYVYKMALIGWKTLKDSSKSVISVSNFLHHFTHKV